MNKQLPEGWHLFTDKGRSFAYAFLDGKRYVTNLHSDISEVLRDIASQRPLGEIEIT